MRLTSFQIDSIKILAKKHFGEEAVVYLFGSRTDDRKKGGDIDLFIYSGNQSRLTIEAKIHFLTELNMKIGERKIDVVFDNPSTRKKKNFYHSINLHKIEL